MKEFIVTWSIQNISSSWHKTGQKIISPKFFAGPIQNSAWTLGLYPRGIEDSDYISLQLRREKGAFSANLAVTFEFSCLTADSSVHQSSFIPQGTKVFKNDDSSKCEVCCFMQRFEVFGRRKSLYLPKDTLTLRCRIWQEDGAVHKFGQCFAQTVLEIERIISVQNISRILDKHFRIQSEKKNRDIMSVDVLYYGDKVDVKMEQIDDVKIHFSTCKLSLMDKTTGRKLCEHEIYYFGQSHVVHWTLPISYEVSSGKNEFELITELVYATGEIKSIVEDNYPPKMSEFLSNYTIRSSKLYDCLSISDELWKLYAEKVLCDVELKTQTKSFFVHEIVLRARSEVFHGMLKNETKENRKECIEIGDISDEIMELFIQFLYTDVIENLTWDMAIKLYYTSDKFKVDALKFLCCSYLINNLDINRVSELLMLAKTHLDVELKRRVNKIIWENDVAVFTSITWKKFADEEPCMAKETMLSKYEREENQDLAETYSEMIENAGKLKDDLGFYFEDAESDIEIKCTDKTFHAHKVVLCACSPIFMEMFAKNSSEESTDFYDMKEWESVTVSRLLRFLYFDSLKNIEWNTAMKLYLMAIKLKIQRLKFKCSCFLLEKLGVSNAIDVLQLAHEHGDAALKSAVVDYICLYDEEIFGSDDWARLSETKLLLANETMRTKYKRHTDGDEA